MEYFYDGLITDQYCPWCQNMHKAKIFTNRFRWCCLFHDSCGREKVLGYTIPVATLQKSGLVSQPDVSPQPRVQNLVDNIRQEEAHKEQWHLDEISSGRTRGKYL